MGVARNDIAFLKEEGATTIRTFAFHGDALGQNEPIRKVGQNGHCFLLPPFSSCPFLITLTFVGPIPPAQNCFSPPA
jgi:hypothetical protein